MNPLVCIILVNYNGFKDTVDCIRSLKNISYDNYKIIVVDNASTVEADKNDLIYIKENSDYIESSENLGFSGGNNVGIKHAEKYSPKFYLLLNNDTVVEPDFLKELVTAYKEHPDTGIFTGKIRFYSSPDKLWFGGGELNMRNAGTSHIGYMDTDSENYQKNFWITFATGCLWLLPKKTIETVGLLEEDYFLYCEDTDYCFRVLKAGLRILYVGKSCIYHKVSASAGNESDLQNYYTIRNTFWLVERYLKNKFLIKKYYTLKYLKAVLFNKIKYSVYKSAYSDFKNKITGRRLE